MLEIKNVSVSFKNKRVLENVSIDGIAGEIIGVVAPNGTGKSTLLHVMINFLQPNKGSVLFEKKYTFPKDEIYIRKQIAFLPDQADLFNDMTGYEHLKFYARMWNAEVDKTDTIIERLHMASYVKKKVKTYSLGMRQRLCFAMVLVADTKTMLLDEVMNGLDPSNVALISEILNEVKGRGKLIFIASHLLNNLDLYADRVLYLQDAHIIHELKLNEDTDLFFKISAPLKHLETIQKMITYPKEKSIQAENLLCIPIDNTAHEKIFEWMEICLSNSIKEVTIGPIGTSEYYELFYRKGE
ncbi:ABC transporter ATP-binding protein [Psychrobacillus sp. L4]|uniref:ABC transporter ATP-binding protein n=1 Tax=Psychrobacillus sp. L4 TaxID=3236892 RepID=UPI0036F1A763